ncbi:hypothetical protein EW146_g3385 [Bondarzewia mesenterica]|uniref:Aminotransferase class I/classII large domain-containing protein n=1 Tax=Bondarzewia mesenterica TaxID=1095465 RepID=A0A4S4LZI7_9AGAM|nr:hypothetical protein EW146_g3385 [Bondarzewia mesenterica]
MATEKWSKSIDLSHHLSDLANARTMSPLKGLQKYFGRENMIAFAGGLPSTDYFPFATVSADALVADSFPLAVPSPPSSSPFSWLWHLFGSDKRTERTSRIVVPKAPSPDDGGLNLSVALQYGPATGMALLQAFIQDFSAKVYQPAFSDFTTLVHTGNTDGWSRVVMTLCNKGDTIIAEEWTYPSALASAAPFGVRVMPVGMDAQGMRADSLRQLLSEWDESKGHRPHVMYTVPVGQNPSGATMKLERKKEIYDICVEFGNVIIAEDDPYFFLQVDDYVPKAERTPKPTVAAKDEITHFLGSLAPSYLKIDYQGRVIRLDTFSKTVAPGVRLGWFTCNPLFAERLERQGETTTQSPCGLGQTLVTKLLQNWKYEGYIRWLRGLRIQYQLRRDLFVDLLSEEFDLMQSPGTRDQSAWNGCTVYTAYPKARPRGLLTMSEKSTIGAVRKPLFSFVPPSAGMFVWVKLHFDQHPMHRPRGEEEEETLEMQLWTALADAGVLTAPGWFFVADKQNTPTDPNVEGHMRMSFSNAEAEEMKRGVAIFSKTLKDFFKN